MISGISKSSITLRIIIIFLAFLHSAKAGPYTEIPKIFTKEETEAKNLKIGYNLTNNITQKQSLFFIEGILRDTKIDHTSRLDLTSASTQVNGEISASTDSTLFRTTTFRELHKFGNEKEPLIMTAVGYARLYNFSDNITAENSMKDQIATAGIGISNSKVYTVGFSVGARNADVFFDGNKQNIRSYIYRPSFVYNNSVKNIIPRFMKEFLMDYEIFDFATETNLKLEYALIASYNTNIEQIYLGFEKSISKHISLSIFYDIETTSSLYQQMTNKNRIEKISTSLVIKL